MSYSLVINLLCLAALLSSGLMLFARAAAYPLAQYVIAIIGLSAILFGLMSADAAPQFVQVQNLTAGAKFALALILMIHIVSMSVATCADER